MPHVRRPGTFWTWLPCAAAVGAEPVAHVRIGYARAETIHHSFDAQHDSLTAAGVTRIFLEDPSTRAADRPELENAVAVAHEIRASGCAVTLVMDEHKRLGQSIVLARLAEELRTGGIGLQFLSGSLQGIHDPGGVVFTVLAALSDMQREYNRNRVLERLESRRQRGEAVGMRVTDDNMLAAALHLREEKLSLRKIAARLVISKGAKAGQHPSPATVLRMLRKHDESTIAVKSMAACKRESEPCISE
ncbi:recombinase family protein [Streptomyces halstedii]|uniref:recombinase family protein n=1 Tax=Streptomyces halstedii TaxID=1944 RepID=UPI0036B4695B